jgi:hypothetical protein
LLLVGHKKSLVPITHIEHLAFTITAQISCTNVSVTVHVQTYDCIQDKIRAFL